MDKSKSKTFGNFTILNNALVFLIKLNKTAVHLVPKMLPVLVFSSKLFL